MKSVSYESLQAEHAWMIISDQLQQRNNMLAKGISYMERNTKDLPMANRLMILRYHLKLSIRQLTEESGQSSKAIQLSDKITKQWQHVHQSLFLLRQIDTEIRRATYENETLRVWFESLEDRVCRSAQIHLN